MQNKKSLLLMLAMAFFAVLVLVGCSDDSTTEEVDKKDSDTSTETAAAETEYPMTIKHALGEAVLESKPERIVTIQWANHDIALALGVVPVGFSAANFGVQDDSGLLPWTKEKLDELGATDPNVFQDTDGLDFEAISDAKSRRNPCCILRYYRRRI